MSRVASLPSSVLSFEVLVLEKSVDTKADECFLLLFLDDRSATGRSDEVEVVQKLREMKNSF